MKTLTPLSSIAVPTPPPLREYATDFMGKTYAFHGLKALLGAADFSKAGDRNANLAAPTEAVREAARTILASLTLQHLYDNPLLNDDGDGGRVDAVMRVNYDIDRAAFQSVAALTLGKFKDLLLNASSEDAGRLGLGLTGIMAAAVAKLCDTHELIYIARKIRRPAQARTRIGLPGTLSSRLQPNHPVDDPRGVAMLVYQGLSLGGGDALIGMNPAIDTVENISALLKHLDALRRRTGAPTQICVLAHVKTQMACLERGAPVEIMFQSLAGTERTLLTEFDVSIDLLDSAYRMMAERGPLSDARQFMYFETGQGSEFTYGKHDGMDMTTTEALTYGLARRYDPFMVNNVTGFIGPETHLDNFEMILANLQDHFMGKLLGLPMGMAPCYTLHAKIGLDGQQMATELLASAGANYYMDVGLNIDRMLAYFDTSGHDNQTLREIHGRTTTPEYLEWALARGIFRRTAAGGIERGPTWGNPRQFCESDEEFQELKDATPALYGLENAGSRPADAVSRQVRINLAVARDAVYSELREDELRRIAPFRIIETAAASKEIHLNSPSLGAQLSAQTEASLKPEPHALQIVVSDGLSAEAVHHNLPELWPVLAAGLEARKISYGRPFLARYGRVKLAETLAVKLHTPLTIILIGERPGGDALASRSLSAYLVYQITDDETRRAAAAFSGNPAIRFETTVISNIYSGGIPPLEAASVIVEKAAAILSHKAGGNRLEAM